MWGAEVSSPWTVTSFSGSFSNNSTTISGATWTLSDLTVGSNTKGEPNWSISGSKWKFGNSKDQFWSSYTLSTDYFKDYAVTKVEIGCYDNGKTESSVTVMQGSVTIGTQSVSTTTTTNVATLNETKGNGGTLSITFTSTVQASYFTKLTITFENLSSSVPCTVTFNVGDHGTCSTESLTEASAGTGVTLPAVDANDGWHFEGWSKDETPTSANAGAAGATFKPTQSCTVYAYYKVIPATPTFNVDAGEVEKGTTVTLSCTTDGATIKYTTDGNDPTSSSTTYSSAIILNADQTIKAFAIKDGVSSEVATATYTIATHTAQFSINGEIKNANNCYAAKGEAITFPADPKEDGVEFMGWMKGAGIDGTQDDAPTMVDKAAEKMGTDNVTYYAVFAVAEEGGASSYKEVSSVSEGTYVLVSEKTNNKFRYMPNTASAGSNPTLGEGITMSTSDGVTSLTNSITDNMLWDLVSTGSANQYYIRPHGNSTVGLGTTNSTGGNIRISSNYVNTKWTISTSTNYNWQFKNNNTTAMYLAVYADSNWRNYDNASTNQNGKFYLFKEFGGISYTDYCTTVSLDPQPTIVLSETALTEYAGNTNNSISVSVSEPAYTGILEASTDNDVVATASIVDGKVVIEAKEAGSATITITAPAVEGSWRKATATIAVTVKNKLAADLTFAELTQTVSMDAEPFAAYTISSKATDAETVTYSLDIKGDATGTPIASLSMVEGVPTITLSGSKATTDSRTIEVVATTEETHTYAAGEARYQLIVTKRDPQIAWSAASVTLDLNEEGNLPTLANPRNLTITYNSTNKDVADFNEGVLELKKAGTTTIHASIGSSGYYDAKTVSYELTFAPTYTVSFKYIDDTKAAEDLREETTGAGVELPGLTVEEGKLFKGWSTSAEPTSANAGVAGATYKPTANTPLYAYIVDVYAVTFNGTVEYGSFEVKNGNTAIASGDKFEANTTLTVVCTNDDHYHVASVTYNDTEISYENNNYSFTMPAEAVKVAVEFAEDAKYSVNWEVNGIVKSTESLYADQTVTAPAVDAIGGKVFRGWTTEKIEGDIDDEPTYVNVTSKSITDLGISDEITYYAVFATQSGEGNPNILKSVSGTITSGDYYLVDTYDGVDYQGNAAPHFWAMNGGLNASSGTSGGFTAMDISSYAIEENNSLTLDLTDVSESAWPTLYTITISNDGVSISRGEETYYCQGTNVSADLKTAYQSDYYIWSRISEGQGVNANRYSIEVDHGTGERCLLFYDHTASKNNNRTFKNQYRTNRGVGGTKIDEASFGSGYFYFLQAGSASYSGFCTSVTTTPEIGAGNWSTFCRDYDYVVTEGTAYSASFDNGVVTLTPFEEGTVFAAGTGVAIKAQSQYTITPATGDYTTVNETGLFGTIAPTAQEEGYAYYGITTKEINGENVTGFAKASSTLTLPAGKAFLKVAAVGAPARLDMTVLDRPNNPITTGVEQVTLGEGKKMLVRGQLVIIRGSKMYDMNGRLVK